MREDLQAAHRLIWEHVRAPGTWWTGAQRVAIAAETRRAVACRLCAARKAALSSKGVTGTHDTEGALPPPVVDVIHRVRTDPARLSREWFDGVMSETMSDAAYVELIGVVTIVTGVDYVARALGITSFPLPSP
ncbi:MAG TPA: alkylhydroperoxidase-related (seleno)protein, partial [Dongiaceae bacterium]|nr:alkylhydroperoxidase-related (seleno)protein [Dongiaceae bacterium]